MPGDASGPGRGGAELAAALINTSPRVWRDDKLATPEQLMTFLHDHGLGAPRPATAEDVEGAHHLRARLWQVFDADDERVAVAVLNTLVDQWGIRPRLTDEDRGWRWSYEPADGLSPIGDLATAATIGLLRLIADTGLGRLGHCAAHGCAGVFVDTTRNRSRRYCIPQLCGNRTNLAAYRARRRAEQKASP